MKNFEVLDISTMGETNRTCIDCGRPVAVDGRRRAICGKCRIKRQEARDARKQKNRELSGREMQIVLLIAEGRGNKEIAWDLKLTIGTVKEYIYHIFHKLDLANRTELALWAKCRFRCPNAQKLIEIEIGPAREDRAA